MTTEQKHTPGPLTIRAATQKAGDGHLDFAICGVVNGEQAIIGEAFGRVSESSFASARANATLWAAAPAVAASHARLLAALESLVHNQHTPAWDTKRTAWKSSMSKAEDAIAQAPARAT